MRKYILSAEYGVLERHMSRELVTGWLEESGRLATDDLPATPPLHLQTPCLLHDQ